MPVLMLEAWAYKILVLCTKVAGIEELAIDNVNCIMAEAKNPSDLSRKIVEIYNKPEIIPNIVKTANTNVLQFSIETYIENIQKFYTKF
jgi:glycosyltransferase involved in cell wall biosynthesis